MLVDSHCHLDFPDFAAERDAIVARAREQGIGRLVTISTKVHKFTIMNGRHPDGYTPQILTRWFEFLELYVNQKVPRISDVDGRFTVDALSAYSYARRSPFRRRTGYASGSTAAGCTRWRSPTNPVPPGRSGRPPSSEPSPRISCSSPTPGRRASAPPPSPRDG